MTKSQIELWGKRSLKTLAAPLARGWRETLRRQTSGDVLILAYHRIVADLAQAERDSIHGLVVSTATFRRHLELVRETYDVVTLDEALARLQGAPRRARPVAVITLDDGYQDVYDHAWPALQALGLPALVYLPTALIGARQLLDHDRLYWLVRQAHERGLSLCGPLAAAGLPSERVVWLSASRDSAWVAEQLNYQPLALRQALLQGLETALGLGLADYPPGYRLLDWAMIRTMRAGGLDFGAHSERHPILTLEAAAAAEQEIQASKRVLEAQLNCPIRHFAYPNGYYNEAIRQIVARAGFASATTTHRALVKRGADWLTLGRISLCEESTRGITGNFSAAVARLRLAA